mmetsp:Transcript_9057/g.16865  ORF Transcript_9057/g.16865 Transcript_9057/m.16865 type:complete len:98 (-) Transcript_9057:383-676(-)
MYIPESTVFNFMLIFFIIEDAKSARTSSDVNNNEKKKDVRKTKGCECGVSWKSLGGNSEESRQSCKGPGQPARSPRHAWGVHWAFKNKRITISYSYS